MRPVRLQLSRRKGFDLQAHSRAVNGLPVINVARPSQWGNPFIVGRDGDRSYCVELFAHLLAGRVALGKSVHAEDLLRRRQAMIGALPGLRGHNLACWCPPGAPCHADVLLELANSPSERTDHAEQAGR